MLHLATASTSFSGDSDPANVRGRARVYASVNEGKPESFFDSKKFKLEWGDIKVVLLFFAPGVCVWREVTGWRGAHLI